MTNKFTIVPVRFFISGKEVTRANWHKFGLDVTEEKLDKIAHAIFGVAGPIRCLIHGKVASIECHGTNLKDLKFKVDACCGELGQRVSTALESIRSIS